MFLMGTKVLKENESTKLNGENRRKDGGVNFSSFFSLIITQSFVTLHTDLKYHNVMTTVTVQIPTGQVGWFEQMLRTMGWAFRREESPVAEADEKPRVFEAEVDELLTMFNTDQISQEDVDRECELVREELYNARQTR